MIPLFAQKSSQLSALLRKSTAWKGGRLPENALAAFNDLKNTLLHRPSIKHPDFSKDFQIHCDIAQGSKSNQTKGSMSGILTQCEGENTYTPCGFWSQILTDKEMKFPSFLLEKMAVWKSYQPFYHYVSGKQVTVFTDSFPVVKLSKKQQDTYDTLHDFISQTGIQLVYVSGKQHVGDILTRYPCSPVETNAEIVNNIITPPEKLKDLFKSQLEDIEVRQTIHQIQNGSPIQSKYHRNLPDKLFVHQGNLFTATCHISNI